MIDWVLAVGVVLFAGGLALVTVLAWRGIDRRVERRRLANAFAKAPRPTTVFVPADLPADPPEYATCGVPTEGADRCGLLAGHIGDHVPWPARDEDDDLFTGPDAIPEPCQPIGCDNGIHLPGCPYAAVDADDDEVLEVDPPVVPAARLNAVGGYVEVGGRRVHRSCNEDRRDGRHERVCTWCNERLGMAPAGGAT